MRLVDLVYSMFNDGEHAILDFSDGKEIGNITKVDLCGHTSAYHNTYSREFEFVEALSEYSNVEIKHGVLDTLANDDSNTKYVASSGKEKWKFIEGNGEKYAGDIKILESDFKRYINLKREYLEQKLQKYRKSFDVRKLQEEILKISHEAKEHSTDWGYQFAKEKDIILDMLVEKSGIELSKRFKFTYGREMEEERRRAGVPSFTPIHIEVDHRESDIVIVREVGRDNGMKYNVREYLEANPELSRAIEIARNHNAINETIRHHKEFKTQYEKGNLNQPIVVINLKNEYFLDDKDLSWLMG